VYREPSYDIFERRAGSESEGEEEGEEEWDEEDDDDEEDEEGEGGAGGGALGARGGLSPGRGAKHATWAKGFESDSSEGDSEGDTWLRRRSSMTRGTRSKRASAAGGRNRAGSCPRTLYIQMECAPTPAPPERLRVALERPAARPRPLRPHPRTLAAADARTHGVLLSASPRAAGTASGRWRTCWPRGR
jgi:hypothetical protein